MSSPSLIVFDDRAALRWEPFTLTRPAGELLFGTSTLRARIERSFGLRCARYLTAGHLRGFEEEDTPSVAPHAEAPDDGDRLFVLSRFVPADSGGAEWEEQTLREGPLTCEGRVVGWYAPAGRPAPGPDRLLDPPAGPDGGGIEVRGRLLENVWDLIARNPDRIAADVRARFPAPATPALPAGAHHWGEHPLVVDPTARVEPGAVLDTSAGPIWLDGGAVVRAFSCLRGPVYVGRDSQVLGGDVESASIGPVCKVRGELAASIVTGYCNKAHDGHLGHALLGRWVNLGAGTTNSDLKNNYGSIRIWSPDGDVDTGEIKIGCFLGDHVKTGIGMLINTGTVIGAGSSLWGAVLPPKYVPPFSWGSGDDLTEYRIDKFLEVAERAMARRDVTLGEGMRGVLRGASERGRASAEPGAAPRG